MKQLTTAELEAGLDSIRQAPKDEGVLELIVRRPRVGAREVLAEGELDREQGLVGDTWSTRASTRTRDGSPHPDMQLNVMNSRVIDMIAGEKTRWGLAGDQLYVDFDLRLDNLPPGTRFQVGSTTLEVSDVPHTGCAKFTARFGSDATRFVNAKDHRELRLRGMNTRVITPGTVRPGDSIRKL